MKGLKFLITLLFTGNLLTASIFAQSSEMLGRDNFPAQQRALIVRIEQQESRLVALEKEIGALRTRIAVQTQAAASAPAPKANDLRSPASASNSAISMQGYAVRSGDNLVAIARLHGVSVADLMKVNNLSSDRIQIGDQLIIPIRGRMVAATAPTPAPIPTPAPAPVAAPAAAPGANTYTIASGDTIARVARKHSVSIESIISANNLRNPDRVSIGQQLIIPAQAPATRPSNTATASPQPPINRAETITPSTPRPAAPAPKETVAAEPTPENPFPTGYAYYTIVSGDSLYSIGELFGTSQKELEELNDIKPGGTIHPDQQIVVPVANYKGPFVQASN